MSMRDFSLKISPRMLELLSQDLYTNIYFVLAELIANSYDADAENVYIYIDESEIRVEDDGNGMSEEEIDEGYLIIGSESRTGKENARTKVKKRLKMGRKGVGKLAALSVSNGFKLVSVKNGIATGIVIPKRIQKDDELLKVLTPNDYTLKQIKNNGTAVIMENPTIAIPKLKGTIVKNIAKIFPNKIDDFTIHIIYKGSESLVVPDEKDSFDRLATLITIGEQKKYLVDELDSEDIFIQKKHFDEYITTLEMQNNNNENVSVELKIYGWIATYKTTKGMKKEINEFSDNYLAIFAHNKMGQRNILDFVGRNRVYESYIVGNLYIDAFENSELPDMAGTNRQGYNENDPRWIAALQYIRSLTDDIVKMHGEYAKKVQFEKDKAKQKKREEAEEQLTKKLTAATNKMTTGITTKLGVANQANAQKVVSEEIEAMKPLIGFKAAVDASKKKIIISQTLNDKKVADIVYQMLLFNGIPKEDIIYSNCDDPEANLPENDIYGYLRKFFVQSASNQMIYALFITSENVVNLSQESPALSWGVLMEIGAAWITQSDHWIFNVNDFKPEAPLNIEDKWVVIKKENDIVSLTSSMVNSFCNKIIATCMACGYSSFKTFEANKNHLIDNYISLYEPN